MGTDAQLAQLRRISRVRSVPSPLSLNGDETVNLSLLRFTRCRFTSEFVDENGEIKLVAQPTTDEKCPNCSEPMVVKNGRFGRFLACSAYPKCKTTKAITTGIQCPECKQGELSEKRTRFGKSFSQLHRNPECKYATLGQADQAALSFRVSTRSW